jgi:DNA-binding NarL/FixJ family response regulator
MGKPENFLVSRAVLVRSDRTDSGEFSEPAVGQRMSPTRSNLHGDPSMAIRVLLVDDHEMIRAGIRSILEKESLIQIVGEACNGRKAIEAVRALLPDVVLMDIGMPELNGVEATRQILGERPETRVIAVAGHTDTRFVPEMLKAGAVGHIAKSAANSEFAIAVFTAARGDVHLSPKILGAVLSEQRRREQMDIRGVYEILTVREREVLQLVAEGHSSKECAVRLKVGTKTVETHRNQIMRKLSIRSVAELTKYAIREGLTSLDI